MVLQCVRWLLHSHLNQKIRCWLMLASGLGIAATLFMVLLGTARANQSQDLLHNALGAEEACFDLKAAALAYTDGAAAPQWALTITYTHRNGLNQSQAITPTVTAQVDNTPISLRIISRHDSPTDGQYDLYVDVQHRGLFEPSDTDMAGQLAGAVETLWRQLKHVALDAAMPNDTKPAFSCNCVCPAINGVKIEPRQLMSSPDPGAEPATAFEAMFSCIRLGSGSGRPFQTWQVGYEKSDWRIVVVGQVEFLDDLAKPNVSLDDLAGWLNARYQKLIPSYPGKVLIILFDSRNTSDQPVIDDARLSRLAEEMMKRLSRSQAGMPEILIVDYRDEALVDILAPPIETVLTVGLPQLFSRKTLNGLSFTVNALPCPIPVTLSGTGVTTMPAENPGDLVDLWQELSLFFLVLVTVVGSWTLLLSTVAYRWNWFGIREKLELAFIFPWYRPTNKGAQPSDGAPKNAKDT